MKNSNYKKNNFFNRTFRKNKILEKQILDKYSVLKDIIPLRKFHIEYADKKDAETLNKLRHNPEYIGPNEGSYKESFINDRYINYNGVFAKNKGVLSKDTKVTTIHKGKMLVNEDSENPMFVSVKHPGHYTTLINKDGLSNKDVEQMASLDILSHGLHDDVYYNNVLIPKLEKELVNVYGEDFINRNGGVDAYVRAILSPDNEEYAPYLPELKRVDQKAISNINDYIKHSIKYQSAGMLGLTDPQKIDAYNKKYYPPASKANAAVDAKTKQDIHINSQKPLPDYYANTPTDNKYRQIEIEAKKNNTISEKPPVDSDYNLKRTTKDTIDYLTTRQILKEYGSPGIILNSKINSDVGAYYDPKTNSINMRLNSNYPEEYAHEAGHSRQYNIEGKRMTFEEGFLKDIILDRTLPDYVRGNAYDAVYKNPNTIEGEQHFDGYINGIKYTSGKTKFYNRYNAVSDSLKTRRNNGLPYYKKGGVI